MQCSHSKHLNIIRTWGYNCNKTNLYVLMQISHLSKLFKMSKKWKKRISCHCLCQKNLSKICMLLSNLETHLSKLIFIGHHVTCSLISSCYNNLNMLMSVKLIVIQLELNGIGYKLVFHSYSKSTSNTWYAFEKYKPNPQKVTWV